MCGGSPGGRVRPPSPERADGPGRLVRFPVPPPPRPAEPGEAGVPGAPAPRSGRGGRRASRERNCSNAWLRGRRGPRAGGAEPPARRRRRRAPTLRPRRESPKLDTPARRQRRPAGLHPKQGLPPVNDVRAGRAAGVPAGACAPRPQSARTARGGWSGFPSRPPQGPPNREKPASPARPRPDQGGAGAGPAGRGTARMPGSAGGAGGERRRYDPAASRRSSIHLRADNAGRQVFARLAPLAAVRGAGKRRPRSPPPPGSA